MRRDFSDMVWFNPSQPQTMQAAVFLLYLDAVFILFDSSQFSSRGVYLMLVFLNVGAAVVGALGLANGLKWGWPVAIVASFMPLFRRLYLYFVIGDLSLSFISSDPLRAIWYILIGAHLISFMFECAIIAALWHKLTRDYVRVWMR